MKSQKYEVSGERSHLPSETLWITNNQCYISQLSSRLCDQHTHSNFIQVQSQMDKGLF